MVDRVGHVAFTVANMSKSLAFYCDVLGCERAFEVNKEDGTPWIVYILCPDGRFLELFYGGEVKPESSAHVIGFNHICFEVDDVQLVANQLVQRNAPLDVAPKQGLDKNWQCWSHDPDGNRIEFMQIAPDSPQANARKALANYH